MKSSAAGLPSTSAPSSSSERKVAMPSCEQARPRCLLRDGPPREIYVAGITLRTLPANRPLEAPASDLGQG